MTEGGVPKDLKMEKVTPVHINGNTNHQENCRPIRILQAFSMHSNRQLPIR